MTKTEQLAEKCADKKAMHEAEYYESYVAIKDTYINGAHDMLERVCKYIEEHIFDFPWYDTESELSSTDIVEEIRKAMEE